MEYSTTGIFFTYEIFQKWSIINTDRSYIGKKIWNIPLMEYVLNTKYSETGIFLTFRALICIYKIWNKYKIWIILLLEYFLPMKYSKNGVLLTLIALI